MAKIEHFKVKRQSVGMRRVPPRQPELTACSPSSGLCCCLLCHEPPSFWGPTSCPLPKVWEEMWLPRWWFEAAPWSWVEECMGCLLSPHLLPLQSTIFPFFSNMYLLFSWIFLTRGSRGYTEKIIQKKKHLSSFQLHWITCTPWKPSPPSWGFGTPQLLREMIFFWSWCLGKTHAWLWNVTYTGTYT